MKQYSIMSFEYNPAWGDNDLIPCWISSVGWKDGQVKTTWTEDETQALVLKGYHIAKRIKRMFNIEGNVVNIVHQGNNPERI